MFRYIVRGLTGPLPGTVALSFVLTCLPDLPLRAGFCAFVSGTWVVGSNVLIAEFGISPNNTVSLPADNAKYYGPHFANRASTPFLPFPDTSGPGWSVNCFHIDEPCFSGTLVVPVSFGIIQARNTTAEIEFTNFIYRPAILKLCKNVTGNIPVGTPVYVLDHSGRSADRGPIQLAPITVPAGSCTFVNPVRFRRIRRSTT